MKEKRTPRPATPILLPGALYSREEIVNAFGVSEDTVARWRAAGLRIRQPGTKRGYVFSDELMAVIRLLTD